MASNHNFKYDYISLSIWTTFEQNFKENYCSKSSVTLIEIYKHIFFKNGRKMGVATKILCQFGLKSLEL